MPIVVVEPIWDAVMYSLAILLRVAAGAPDICAAHSGVIGVTASTRSWNAGLAVTLVSVEVSPL